MVSSDRTLRHTKALGFFLQCNGGDIGEGATWNCVASASLHVRSYIFISYIFITVFLIYIDFPYSSHHFSRLICNLQVLSKRPGVEPHVRRITHTFYPKENDWGYSSFMHCEVKKSSCNVYSSNFFHSVSWGRSSSRERHSLFIRGERATYPHT